MFKNFFVISWFVALFTFCVYGANYYVDNINGSDDNGGITPSLAWQTLTKVNSIESFQPGDSILLISGGVWTGSLKPNGSGSEGNPIVLGKYGGEARPIINGGGLDVVAPVALRNQSYWVIRDLEITNNNNNERDGIRRRGLSVTNPSGGIMNSIHVLNNYVHHVRGSLHGAMAFGGIVFVADSNYVMPSKDGTNSFNDVLVEGNIVSHTSRTGISFWDYSWQKANQASTNVKIRNNVVSYPDGDGILSYGCILDTLEHNIAHHCSNFTDPATNWIVSAGIWTTRGYYSVIQFNEAYAHQYAGADGQGFDIDGLSTGTILQYNYSHDNYGGFLLLCWDANNKNPIVRYNISQNDGRHLIRISASNAHIYNNVFYIGHGMSTKIVEDEGGTAVFNNNIIYNYGSGGYNFPGGTWSHNSFYGNHPASEPSDPYKLTSDPLLVAPGSGGIGRASVEGYRLQVGSPSLGSGLLISGSGGKDFWGNPVSSVAAPNRGVYSGLGIYTGNDTAVIVSLSCIAADSVVVPFQVTPLTLIAEREGGVFDTVTSSGQYVSLDTSVVIVNVFSGLVTAVSVGNGRIVGCFYNAFGPAYDTLVIRVVPDTAPHPDSISLATDSISLVLSPLDSVKIGVAGYFHSSYASWSRDMSNEVVWSSGDESVVTVSEGWLKSVSAGGPVMVTAGFDGKYDTCFVTVSPFINVPIGYWAFENSGFDSSGNGHTAVLSGGAVYGTGAVGQGVLLDGTDDVVTMGQNTQFGSMAKMTVALWLRLNALPPSGTQVPVLSKPFAHNIVLNNSGSFQFAVATTSNGWYSSAGNAVTSKTNLETDEWYFIVGTYDGSRLRIYLDGQLENTASANISGTIVSNSNALRIGDGSIWSTFRYLDGAIDEIRIYNEALGEGEIRQLYLLRDDGTTTGESVEVDEDGGFNMVVSPNPFNPFVNIWVSGIADDLSSLIIYDVNGRMAADLSKTLKGKSGKGHVAWDASNHASGIYVAVFRNGGTTLRKKMMLIR